MPDENLFAAGERRVAWLRIAAVALIVAAERLPHPHPNRATFELAAGVTFGYALAVFVAVHARTPSRRVSLAFTAVDVLAITVLAYLSGGPFSEARLAYFLIPIAVAFRFGWQVTLLATALVLLAYTVQAVTHPARHVKEARDYLLVQTGYLLWIGIAATLFSGVLTARTEGLVRLARGRRQLLAEVMGAEERERRELAETLHDSAIQDLLAARQDIEDAVKESPSPTLDRARGALTEAVSDLRAAIFELHPHVLKQAGLEAALKSVAERASRHGGFDVDLYLDYPHRYPDEQLLFGAAREFLANAARHAHASKVTIRLVSADDSIALTVEDNGVGFDPDAIAHHVAAAHIGLLSQRERIEASGGRLEIASAPGAGTAITATLPLRRASGT